eukprot:TRINITY_DN93718_c0_g1_i1.p1 TRINITY_DN93718_c0_g1~~TRINITY_DN93718_c0_g1_i1.p1  ORF type:complete len:375 (-),score=53.24 TRINITY_DN93718_c0_g1_i1:73-1197(-)
MGLSGSSELFEPAQIGSTAKGEQVLQYTLTNGSLTVKVLNWGATLSSVKTPDNKGELGEVMLGYDEAAPYLHWETNPYFGCVAGRVANRICKGKFAVDGKEYTVATNNGPNHLHGGVVGFDKCIWKCEEHTETSLTLQLHSPDGDEGYPGNVIAKVTYSLPTSSTLRMEYAATTDAPTPVNLTNHGYWNLANGGEGPVLEHEIEIAADFYTPVDNTSIPTGEIRALSGPMDLRQLTKIGKGIKSIHVPSDPWAETLNNAGGGYDHNYVLRGSFGPDGLQPVARVYEPTSGRWMTVRSDQPGVQFYTGNYLTGHAGRQGKGTYSKHHGFCLETQLPPDAINRAHFPSAMLRPGQTYKHVTVHEFGSSSSPPKEPF